MSEFRRSIFLSGFMGSGKSTVGRILAARLGTEFIDLDDEILSHQNCLSPEIDGSLKVFESLREIFEKRGESYFRDLEAATLSRLTHAASFKCQVVALGGGTVLRCENRELIRGAGTLIYLRISPSVLYKRLFSYPAETKQRPILLDLAGPPLLVRINELLEERREAYEDADLICTLSQEDPSQAAQQILDFLTHSRGMAYEKN